MGGLQWVLGHRLEAQGEGEERLLGLCVGVPGGKEPHSGGRLPAGRGPSSREHLWHSL